MERRAGWLGLVVLMGCTVSGTSGGTGSSSSSSSGTASSSGTTSWAVASSGAVSSSVGLTSQGASSPAAFSGRALPGLQTTQRYFPDNAPWYRDVSLAALAADSDAITQWMEEAGPPNGWGTGYMRVDFSLVTVDVPAGTPRRTYAPVEDFYYAPDCDPAPVPVPVGGAVEESDETPPDFSQPYSAYACDAFDDGADCHMLFVARDENRLYELYHATMDGSGALRAGCLAIWDTRAVDPNGRGQQCTSADAAGFPMAPLLFTAEEIAAGEINHAIRFVLPNTMIRQRTYVAPATHGTNTTGPLTAGPYGFQMRLKASFDESGLSPAAQVVARALKKYGMYMADGGNIALTAQSDVLSDVKWDAVGFNSQSMRSLKATDFEVVDNGPTTPVTYDCTRTPITD